MPLPSKKAAKKTAKLKPLRIQGAGIQLGRDRLAELFFITYTCDQINDLLRARSIGIPKAKMEASKRLAEWAVRPESRFDLHIA